MQAAAISLVSAKLDNQYESDRGYYLHMDYNTFTSASKKRQEKNKSKYSKQFKYLTLTQL